MSAYDVVHTGFDHVELDYDNDSLWAPTDPDVAAYIDSVIEEKRVAAEEQGSLFYNGPLVRVRDTELRDEGETLYLELENTNYFSHVGTRDDPDLPKEDRADPLSVGALLQTSDEYLVLGEKSGLNEIGSGEFHIPSGYVADPSTQYARSLNAQPESPIHREVEEELNLSPQDISNPEPRDLIAAVTHQPMLVYEIETELDHTAVAEQWRTIPDEDKEFSQLAFVPAAAPVAGLAGIEPVTYADPDEQIGQHDDIGPMTLRPHAAGAVAARTTKR